VRPSNQSKIRELLQRFPDGLTASEIASRVGIAGAEHRSLRRTLTGMPDAYIDRWVRHQRGPLAAVWCVVVPPPHCPKPDR